MIIFIFEQEVLHFYQSHRLSFCRAARFRYGRGFLAILLRIQKGGLAIEMSGLVIRQETIYQIVFSPAVTGARLKSKRW
jgi:hypothetical protein